MRFPQLPVGQRFSFKGKTYIKTGPLTASEEGTARNQLMLKSATVTPLDANVQLTAEQQLQYSRQEVIALCNRWRAELRDALITGADKQANLSVAEVLRLIEAQRLPVD